MRSRVFGRVRPLLPALAVALAAPAAQAKLKVGEPAPAFTMRTLDGRLIAAEELRGKVVVLNFWATWCVPCRKEMPLLEAFQRVYGKNGLEIFAVATEDSLPPSDLKKFLPDVKLTLVRRMRGDYGPMKGVPTNYVIDRNGILRYAKAGALDMARLQSLLEPLIAEPAVPDKVAGTTVASAAK